VVGVLKNGRELVSAAAEPRPGVISLDISIRNWMVRKPISDPTDDDSLEVRRRHDA